MSTSTGVMAILHPAQCVSEGYASCPHGMQHIMKTESPQTIVCVGWIYFEGTPVEAKLTLKATTFKNKVEKNLPRRMFILEQMSRTCTFKMFSQNKIQTRDTSHAKRPLLT
jgi:hypothetical protein